MKALPVIEYEGFKYFVDYKLKQIRQVENPHRFIDFDSIDMEDIDLLKKLIVIK